MKKYGSLEYRYGRDLFSVDGRRIRQEELAARSRPPARNVWAFCLVPHTTPMLKEPHELRGTRRSWSTNSYTLGCIRIFTPKSSRKVMASVCLPHWMKWIECGINLASFIFENYRLNSFKTSFCEDPRRAGNRRGFDPSSRGKVYSGPSLVYQLGLYHSLSITCRCQ